MSVKDILILRRIPTIVDLVRLQFCWARGMEEDRRGAVLVHKPARERVCVGNGAYGLLSFGCRRQCVEGIAVLGGGCRRHTFRHVPGRDIGLKCQREFFVVRQRHGSVDRIPVIVHEQNRAVVDSNGIDTVFKSASFVFIIRVRVIICRQRRFVEGIVYVNIIKMRARKEGRLCVGIHLCSDLAMYDVFFCKYVLLFRVKLHHIILLFQPDDHDLIGARGGVGPCGVQLDIAPQRKIIIAGYIPFLSHVSLRRDGNDRYVGAGSVGDQFAVGICNLGKACVRCIVGGQFPVDQIGVGRSDIPSGKGILAVPLHRGIAVDPGQSGQVLRSDAVIVCGIRDEGCAGTAGSGIEADPFDRLEDRIEMERRGDPDLAVVGFNLLYLTTVNIVRVTRIFDRRSGPADELHLVVVDVVRVLICDAELRDVDRDFVNIRGQRIHTPGKGDRIRVAGTVILVMENDVLIIGESCVEMDDRVNGIVKRNDAEGIPIGSKTGSNQVSADSLVPAGEGRIGILRV